MASSQTVEALYHQGEQTLIDYTPGSAVSAGQVVSVGTAFAGYWGVANSAIASGALGAIDIAGVYKVKIGTGESFSAGDSVEWDDTANAAVAAGSGDGDLGIAIADADESGSGDDYVLVKLNQNPQAAT